MISSARNKTIGKRIAAIREHRMLSLTALAAAIGTTKSILFHLEHGHTRVSLEMAVQLAAALHCKVDDLRAPLDARIPRSRVRRRLGDDFILSWNELRTTAGSGRA